MITLYDKSTGMSEIIYAILDDDKGYPKFLIRKDEQWIYRSAKHYITKEERMRTPYTLFERMNGVFEHHI